MQEKVQLACFIYGKQLSGQKSLSETSIVVTGAIGKCVTLIVAFSYLLEASLPLRADAFTK